MPVNTRDVVVAEATYTDAELQEAKRTGFIRGLSLVPKVVVSEYLSHEENYVARARQLLDVLCFPREGETHLQRQERAASIVFSIGMDLRFGEDKLQLIFDAFGAKLSDMDKQPSQCDLCHATTPGSRTTLKCSACPLRYQMCGDCQNDGAGTLCHLHSSTATLADYMETARMWGVVSILCEDLHLDV